jgi:hypothetical protein
VFCCENRCSKFSWEISTREYKLEVKISLEI